VDEREADVVLVVSHALPIRCILAAAAHGERFDPTRRSVGLATPYLLDGDAVRTAARRLHSLASPSPPRVAHA
jgi:broad specificity phosphatase PhoE